MCYKKWRFEVKETDVSATRYAFGECRSKLFGRRRMTRATTRGGSNCSRTRATAPSKWSLPLFSLFSAFSFHFYYYFLDQTRDSNPDSLPSTFFTIPARKVVPPEDFHFWVNCLGEVSSDRDISPWPVTHHRQVATTRHVPGFVPSFFFINGQSDIEISMDSGRSSLTHLTMIELNAQSTRRVIQIKCKVTYLT